MPLGELQQILALLYTSARARNEREQDLDAFCLRHHLTPDTAASLAAIAPATISRFATSLAAKRLNEVEKLLPLSVAVMQGEFRKAFWIYGEEYATQGVDRHVRDAVRFARYMAAGRRCKPGEAAVLRLETARLAARGSRGLVVRLLPPVVELCDELNLSRPRWVLIYYLRTSRAHPWRRKQISLFGV